jgi:predicted RNA binding protein YcfA (HicA-like mRNA interferase family)
MSPRLKQLSAREVLAALGAFGFEVVSTRGSHAKLCRELADGTRQILTIPLHRELAPGTLRAIFRQATRFIAVGELRPYFFRLTPAETMR